MSRLPGTALGPAVILDLAAGCGSALRALAILARKGLIRSDKQLIQYVAVEANPTARAVIKKMYESVAREFPRLFATNDTTGIFPLGHDIRTIADNARVRKKPFRVDLLLASPPCQPFSRANPRAKGMEDDRELFTPVVDLIHVLLATNSQLRWCCENVDFGKEEGERAPFPTLRKARKQVDALLRVFRARGPRLTTCPGSYRRGAQGLSGRIFRRRMKRVSRRRERLAAMLTC